MHKGAELISTERLETATAAAAAVVDAVRREGPRLQALARNYLEEGRALLEPLLRGFRAAVGPRNLGHENTAGSYLSEALQQKLARDAGHGVQLAICVQEYGKFDVRLQIRHPIFKEGVVFLDFKVPTEPGNPPLTLEALQPEYAGM